jgi:MFS family permease
MFNGARLIGPAIGGFLISGFGLEFVFALNALSYGCVITTLAMMNTSELQRAERKVSSHPLADLRDGIEYAFRTPATLLIIILVAIIGTFGYNFTVMMPLITRYVLDAGAVALGFLTAAVGLGAVAAVLLLAGRRSATRTQLFVGASLFTVMLAGVALSEEFFLSMVLLAGLGAAGATFGTTANTSIQIASPDELRGRVVSLYMLLFAGSTPIGGYLTGWMAEEIGVQAAVGVLATMCGVGVLAGGLYYVTHREGVQRTADASRLAVV